MSSAMNDKACTGKVISFTCSADANPRVTSYQLFENEKAILNTSASGTWSKTLKIEGVFVYKCVANNSLGSEYSINVPVTVNVPSSITQITQDQNVTEGDNLTLTCNASGMPQPNVSWIKPGGQRQYGHMLEFTNINRSQAGEYKCEASNECLNATETATIDVQYKPENVQLMSSAMNDKACTGKVISFTCSADANPRVTSYQLFENEKAILNTSASGTWSKTLEIEGMFVYKCVANNSLGSEYSINVPVTVNVPSSITQITQDQNVTEGDNLTLTCNASGMPQPNVSWIKPGGQRQYGHMLEFTNINRSQAGEYKCEASNECLNATETATIDVQYKPENVQLMSSAMNDKACTGKVISFNCSADANPRVTSYQLFENEKAILNTSASGTWSKTLKIEGVFVYKCVANNSLGSEYSINVPVTVNVPSSITQITQDQNVTEGDNLTLTCNASGMPQPNVSWIKPGGQRQYGHMLEFTNINRSQAGEYKCEASNECLNATETATIDVQFISFTCSADANPRVTSYQLFENEKAILNTSASGTWSKTLKIEGVFVYKCVANNSLGSEYSINVPVTVNIPSSITQITQDQNVTEGDNLTLTCNASGMPQPNVSWIKPGGQRQYGHMLEFTNINRSQAGEYKCEANKPENVQLMSSAMNDKACTGKVISFTCSADANPRVTSYQLFENEKAILNTSASGKWSKTLEIEGVFVYKCVANNSLGSEYSINNVQLMSSAMNDKACTGKVISFTCSADANPRVTSYQLFENEKAILNTSASGKWSKTLEIEGVFVYKCVANNSLGSEYSINVPVTVNVPSSIIQITQDQNVTEGDNLTLTCNASGMPQPNVSWIKPGGQRQYGHMLEFTNINRSQAGEYKCEASNECLNATETATIDVQYKPENVQLMSSAMNDKACTGKVISFTCSADANPRVTSYQLFENEKAILNTSASGTWIKTLESEGVFVYKCVANNSLGSEYSMNVPLTVNVPSSITQRTHDQNVTEGDNLTLTCNASGIMDTCWSLQTLTGVKLVNTNVKPVMSVAMEQRRQPFMCCIHQE
ncbi:unnamed protein product [Pocillopora meandrina]|uniref:Ig-like domain-containing protein n=1 Tax=Pocillopora meandrina TaxID=46732 RepID=A0AAU9XZD1_9CNID|nr:unnamed protein product [Pocillopora meandrina]